MIPFLPMHLREVVAISESRNDTDTVAFAVRSGSVIARLLDFQEYVQETPKPLREILVQKVFAWPHLSEQLRQEKSDYWRNLMSAKPLQESVGNGSISGVKSLLGDRGAGIVNNSAQSQPLGNEFAMLISISQSAPSVSDDSDLEESLADSVTFVLDSARKSVENARTPPEREEVFIGDDAIGETFAPTEATLKGMLEAADGRKGAAKKRIAVVTNFYTRYAAPGTHSMVKDDAVSANLKEGLLYTDYKVLFTKPGGRPVLMMQPALFYPTSRSKTLDALRTLYYLTQVMLAPLDDNERARGYVFLADLNGWTMENFSVDYASRWFRAMMSLPCKIHAFVVVSAPSFFPRIFAIISKFMSASFRSRWLFVQPKDLPELFSVVPSNFEGGDFVIDYDAFAEQAPSLPTSLFE